MKKIVLIRDLVKSLSEGEVRIMEKFLVSFDDVKNPESLKMLKLFRELRNSEESDEESLRNIVSPDYKPDSFSKLLLRLKDKIYDTLILDANILRKDAYSDLGQKKIQVRKLMIVAGIVHGKGKLALAMELYEKIIVTCKEFELYTELCESLRSVQYFKGLSEGLEVYQNISDQVSFYENCRNVYNKAKDYYYQLVSRIDFSGSPDTEKEQLEKNIEELEKGLLETNSSNVEYLLLYLKIHHAQLTENYEQALILNKYVVKLLQENKSLYMKRKLASAKLELAHNYCITGSFDEAIQNASEAISFFKSTSFNAMAAKELLFLCHFYNGDFGSSEMILEDLLTNKFHTSVSEFINSKRIFYKANLAFFKKNFLLTHNLLNECREIENDKEGWNFGIRFLSIINDIERNLYDQADSKIESLRKFISRSKNPVSERFTLAYKLLYQLSKNSFDFAKTYKQNQAIVEDLQHTHVWKIRTAELFPIEEWFETRVNEKEYHFKINGVFKSATI